MKARSEMTAGKSGGGGAAWRAGWRGGRNLCSCLLWLDFFNATSGDTQTSQTVLISGVLRPDAKDLQCYNHIKSLSTLYVDAHFKFRVHWGQGSSVNIVTRLRGWRPEERVSITGSGIRFWFFYTTQTTSGPQTVSYPMRIGRSLRNSPVYSWYGAQSFKAHWLIHVPPGFIW
jgi:hypothetical protein